MNIPTGMLVLATWFGSDDGILEAGWHCCVPYWKQVAVMISKNTIRFNAPITHVPTRDNVMVSLDVGVNFHIGQNEQTYELDSRKFFYNFGPNRLEELLKEEIDEGIRDFVKKIKVIRIRDVKTELTQNLLTDLNVKFRPYGVVVE